MYKTVRPGMASPFRISLSAAATFAAAAFAFPAFAQSARHEAINPASYHEVAHYEVGGDGGWDYVACDSAGHRLFIARGSHVQVVSTDTGKVIGDIPDTTGCHGVAIAPRAGKGYVSDGRAGAVTVFDLKTLKTEGTIPVGQGPDAILYDPATERVFTFNAGTKDATAIDTRTGKVVGSVGLGFKPEFAQSNGHGKIFVNDEEGAAVVTFDALSLKVLATTPLGKTTGPSGLAIDPKSELLYAAGDNKLAAVIDGKTGKLVANPEIGDGPDAASFDPTAGLAFTSNGQSGTLSILKQTAPGVFSTTTIKTARGARTMTLDPATHRVYLITAQFEAPAPDAPATPGRRQRPRMLPGSFKVLVYAP
jgi:DNA-binding beta-propeller fold protein YncE